MADGVAVPPSAKELRAKALGYKTKAVADTAGVEFEGVKYFMRPATVGLRGEIFAASGIATDGSSKGDIGKLQAVAVCKLTVDETGARVFDEIDLDALLQSPAGGIVDVLAAAAMKQINVSPEAVSKNSGATV